MTRLALSSALFSFLVACGTSGDGVGVDSGETVGLDADTQAMLDATEAAMAGYESWGQIDGWQGVQPGDTVHGAFVDVRWNETALTAIDGDNADPMPIGSIMVKQGYDDADGNIERNLTVMNKVDGYGWFYASWDAAGDNLTAGSPASCTGCHDAGSDGRLAL